MDLTVAPENSGYQASKLLCLISLPFTAYTKLIPPVKLAKIELPPCTEICLVHLDPKIN